MTGIEKMQRLGMRFLQFMACISVHFYLPNAVAAVQDVGVEQQPASKIEPSSKRVRVESGHEQVTITIGDDLFTRFLFHKKYDKPIFYPIYGPGQIGMTRNWPMKERVPGEAHDHPHHKSMWFSHEINGIDFWSEQGGTVETVLIDSQSKPNFQDSFRTQSRWISKDKLETVLTDETLYQFGADENARWIDAEYTLHASHGDVTMDDTKEGTFALRTHPDLRLTAAPEDGVEAAYGRAFNSNGEFGKSIWGKTAKWVLYSGPIDGIEMSVAIFDHPSNLRHPTTWHARDYGLVAANPFGLHYFQGQPKNAGAYTIREGENLRLRYRVVFMKGNATANEVNQRFAAFASPTN